MDHRKHTSKLPAKHAHAPRLVLVMMALDALRASLRWYDSLPEHGPAASETDKLLCFITCCGWTWEAVRLVRAGERKKWFTRELLCGNTDLDPLWKEIVSKAPSERLRRIERIRNGCFGHFDIRLAKQFLERNRDKIGIPMIVDPDDPNEFTQSRFPWAYEAFASPLWPEPFDVREAQRRIRDIVEFVRLFIALLNVLTAQLYHAIDLHGIPAYDKYYH